MMANEGTLRAIQDKDTVLVLVYNKMGRYRFSSILKGLI